MCVIAECLCTCLRLFYHINLSAYDMEFNFRNRELITIVGMIFTNVQTAYKISLFTLFQL
jgi:hypothetical protein